MTSSGLIVVDKPSGMTSHDVVARLRRIVGTRKVGHGGTLDPMATGVLIIGVERATRLLTYILGCDKRYVATLRLGQTTLTDDADGEVVTVADTALLTERSLPVPAIDAGLAALTGEIDQIPSAVSAIKIRGVRSYARVRAGEEVALAARRVTIRQLRALEIRRTPEAVDVDIDVVCSTGTYVRALARDLGAALGVGGHLTALRRLAVGDFTVDEAGTLETLAEGPEAGTIPLAKAAARILPTRRVTAEEARALAHGGPLTAVGTAGPYAVLDPLDDLIAIVVEREGRARPEAVLAPA
ncbi:MAG: tRNA pseudouridine(55) synthase TruB [Dactylosporangium sp.]|nr:tRNA pseudouridine(55) synthase TruB [Dactylosporangium sp.]NNJ62196.1 tRNA pseudouridine(55) synthase TruB [Dactylosporangium sp.]